MDRVASKRSTVLAVVAFVAAAMAGCGIRGPLEAPPGAQGEAAKSGKAGSGGAAKAPESHRPFVLDGLIR